MKHLLPLIIFAALWLSACRDDIIVDNTPENVFLTFWTILDKNYPYFIERGIDWDSVYTTCYPRAKAARSDEELVVVLTEIIRRLNDRHLGILTFEDGIIGSITPEQTDTLKHEYCSVFHNYGFYQNSYSYPTDFLSDTIKKISYVDIYSFSNVTFEYYNMERFGTYMDPPNCKNGLIIDIRDNGGGNARIMMDIVSHFFENERIVFYTSHKTGKGHSDFGKQEAIRLKGKGTLPESVPIVLLIGKDTYSAGNDFAYIMNDLPNVTLMGEQSGGGGGTIREVLLPNNWILRYPYMKTYSSTGANMEFGIEPDIYMERQTANFDTIENKDPLIVKALEILDSINGI